MAIRLLSGETVDGNISLGDGKELLLGDGSDLQIFHDGNSVIRNQTGNLFIDNYQDDGDIIFRSDDGTGSQTDYFRLDGGDENIQFSKDGKFLDSVKALFGNSNDLQIFHNGSNSFIKDTGTGGLVISTSLFEVYNAAVNEFMIVGTQDGAVDLYHNGSKKFETTSSGVSVTGSIDITGDYKIDGNILIGTTSTYTIIRNPEETSAIFLGDTADPANYYNNTSHIFRSAAGAVYFTINSSSATFAGNITVSNSSPSFNLTDTDNSSNIAFSSVGGALIVNSASDQVYQIGGAEKFRIASSGATFAGSVTSTEVKVVNSTATSTLYAESDTLALLQLKDDGLGKNYNIEIGRSSTAGDLTFRSSDGEKVRFTEAGNVVV